MANAYFYSNIAVPTTLSGNINNSVGSCTVVDTTGWPGSTPFIISVDYQTANEELMKVTNNAAGTLTVTRGFGGTTAVSHSSGAVVRHVWNAQDGTDFRTHEAATSGAHGIAGSFVGTTDAQTLTNKILTSPTINSGSYASGGSLAGTFTGTPTFSGALTLSGTPNITNGAALTGTFSGTPTFNGALTFSGSPNFSATANFNTASSLVQFTKTATSQQVVAAQISGDTFDRFRTYADGKMEWGTGAVARDTNLYRSTGHTLQTDGAFSAIGQLIATPTDTSLDGLDVNLPSGTVGDLLNLRVNSSIQAAMDSSGVFRIYEGNSPQTYTPTWGNIGSATFNTNQGQYWRLGKIIFINIYTTINAAGSGTSTITVDMPSSVQRAARQVLICNVEGIGANGNASSASRGGEVVFLTSGTGATADRLRVDNTTESNIQGVDLLAGGFICIQGWYREA